MRDITISLFFLFLYSFTTSSAQMSKNEKYNISLKNGIISTEAGNLSSGLEPNDQEIFNGKYYRIIQFYDIPSVADRQNMQNKGLNLMDYLPGYAYIASIPVGTSINSVFELNIRSISEVPKMLKLHASIYFSNIPEWAVYDQNHIGVNVMFYNDVPFQEAVTHLSSQIKADHLSYNTSIKSIALKINLKEIQALVELPYVMAVETVDPEGEPENYTGRTLHRGNVIASDAPLGRKYDGSGVTIGMYDDGIIGPHIDYEGRILAQNTGQNNGDHGDHVAGTIMGAGNLNPLHKGMAFGSDFHVYRYTNPNNLYSVVPSEYANKEVYINSTSYSNGCNAGYTGLTKELDTYVRQNKSLNFVFSAGNDGNSDCGYGAGANWGNLTGGHKAGKNVIAVANLTEEDNLAGSSSRGPARDGRIKPDISAKGTSVISTTDASTNSTQYVTKTGTSMSCPGVAGTLGQLYQAYKDLNGGVSPSGGLMKGLILNTADDLGNDGPDFKYGWGRINALTAVENLENNQYFVDVLGQNDSNLHIIPVPANVKQLKVMVYWNDYEANTSAITDLVNNIDFELSDPSLTIYQPWVLDPTPNATALNSPAVRGIDDLNNVEQVTIDNPTPGSYNAMVMGKLIPQGPQEYFVIYTYIMDEVKLTYPIGGESFVPGENEIIRWDAFDNSGNFTLEYSSNNGSSWSTIGTTSGNRRYYTWKVPVLQTGEMKVRVSRGANSDVSDTSFSIIRVPSNLDVEWACPDSVKLTWNDVSGALSYEVSKLGNKYMDSAVTSTQDYAVITGVKPNQTDWLSVKAFGPNNSIGRRAIAIEKPLGTFNCPIPDDASITQVLSPLVSLPNCRDNSQIPVNVRIKNEGTNSLSSIPVSYSINNGPVITEVFPGPLSSTSTTTFFFNAKADFSTNGIYSIKVWTALPVDNNEYNDTINIFIESYTSEVVSLPYSEDFESFSSCGIANNCEGTSCPVKNGWFNHENLFVDDIDWRTDDGGTRTDFTGPSIDHKPGTASGNYLYTEVSGDCSFKEAFLISPCIDLSKGSKPELSFWYHMYGQTIGSLSVDVLYDGQWDLGRIVYSSDRGDVWRDATLDLSKYNGDTINIRFRGLSADGPYGDIAIDDISVIETDNTIGISTSSQQSELSIYPNPTTGKLFIEFGELPGDEINISITDMRGLSLRQNKYAADDLNKIKSIDLSDVAAGVYFVRINYGQESISRKMILK